MKAPPLPSNEAERLAALQSFNILDTAPEKTFDRITNMAARIFNVPVALIGLIDRNRQWYKACQGLESKEVERCLSFCNYTIRGTETIVVADTQQDARFREHPTVTGEPYIRFYAGALLTTSDGYNIGTLCLLDYQPRSFSQSEQEILEQLADIVMESIEQRHLNYRLARTEASFQAVFNSSQHIYMIINPEYQITAFNRMADHVSEKVWKRPLKEGDSILNFVQPKDLEQFYTHFNLAIKGKTTYLEKSVEGTSNISNWFEFSYEPIFMEDGQVSAVCMGITDIDARKKALLALTERDHLLSGIFHSLSSQVAVLDREGIITYVSESWNRFALENKADLSQTSVGVSYLAVCERAAKIEPDVLKTLQAIKAVMNGEQPRFNLEYEQLTPTGVYWFLMQVDPMPASLGGVVITHTDITARHKAEEAIFHSNELFRLSFELSPVGMTLTSLSGQFLKVSQLPPHK